VLAEKRASQIRNRHGGGVSPRENQRLLKTQAQGALIKKKAAKSFLGDIERPNSKLLYREGGRTHAEKASTRSKGDGPT